MINLEAVAQFCFKHQKRRERDGTICYRDFKEWCTIVVLAAKHNKLHLVENENRELIGVCIATIRPATRVVWISEVICVDRAAFRTFIVKAFEWYPDYTIGGKRNNKHKFYKKRNLWVLNHRT